MDGADWRVDMKTSSNHLSRMAVPTVIVEMKVRWLQERGAGRPARGARAEDRAQLQETAARVDRMPGTRDVQFELDKETLATMLDGLGKIRDQLAGLK
jgi:hypothetical protein